MTPDERIQRGRIAALTRHHPHDGTTQELAAQFKADRLAQHIQRIVDAAPALSQHQKDCLAVLLRGAGI